ncbi:tRNA glutamyl-Q(34) synthetase GluQRS [Moraxella haemolytica]|uniref:tRNA glutamyl-Q(34) synthetase GluQRS n=1 Tax=Moraxella haemolytica TaxID=2904119 RepID=UPI002543CD48|nr:tRNA glutamyl-Q(34) synthetase GluQRS [Moraxella sp. ZY171148]WII94945.1 tRNA glutamyl-Q(34) synthetase GluQRS [Moraxella sp. ZY171148]
MLTVAQHRPIIGRFSPSPTGHLHLGSLTTAVASFCHIKSLGGQWLLRMEDVDFERCKAQYSTSILQDLDNLGLHWDGEVVYQSDRQHIYDEFIDMLKPLTYACQCSRKQLQAYLQTHNNTTKPITFNHASKELSQTQDLNQPLIYPRLCLHHSYDAAHPNSKIRLCLPDTLSAFYDGIQGVIWDNPARSLGDVVIKRQNGMINYIFACAIDDGLQNISHIMRGLDILPMTAGQLTINKACQLPHADHHYHLPLLHNKDGQKLSKQNLAKPIKDEQPTALLIDALRRLKQPIPKDMMDGKTDEILAFAIKHWNNQPLIQQSSLGISDDN